MLTNPIFSPFPAAQSSPVAGLIQGAAGTRPSRGGGPIQDLVQLSLAAARPAFELDFNIAQNQALARLDAQVEELQNADFGAGRTALLKVKAARLDRELDELVAHRETVSSNRQTVIEALSQLTDLRALADPSTATEFEDKRTELLATLDKLKTANPSRFGAPDGLSAAKSDGTAAIGGIVTNNFASATDIQNAQDTIDSLSDTLTFSFTILELNQDGASKLISGTTRGLTESNNRIDEIVKEERQAKIDEIQAERDKTAAILTNISLAFETTQAFSSYIAQSTVLPPQGDPGSVLNLFA